MIVCVDESAFPGKSYAQDKDESYKVDRDTSEILSILNGAEELIDVTGTVTGSDKADEPLGLDMPDEQAVSAEDVYTIKYIHSDRYSTKQLIQMCRIGTPKDIGTPKIRWLWSLTQE